MKRGAVLKICFLRIARVAQTVRHRIYAEVITVAHQCEPSTGLSAVTTEPTLDPLPPSLSLALSLCPSPACSLPHLSQNKSPSKQIENMHSQKSKPKHTCLITRKLFLSGIIGI